MAFSGRLDEIFFFFLGMRLLKDKEEETYGREPFLTIAYLDMDE